MIKLIVQYFRKKSRENRARLFRTMIRPQPSDTILDLGGSDGSYIASIIPGNKNIIIADHDRKALEKASSQFGYKTIHLDGSNKQIGRAHV